MALKPNFYLSQVMYHGATKSDCASLAIGKVDASKGGGELGKGFYLGNYYHVAVAWARHKNSKDAAVVSFSLQAFPTSGLYRKELSRLTAVQTRLQIRQAGQQKSYTFNEDTVHTYIVGGSVDRTAEQLKAESKDAENFLNQAATVRTVKNV